MAGGWLLPGWLAGWLAAWLAGSLPGWLAGWLAGLGAKFSNCEAQPRLVSMGRPGFDVLCLGFDILTRGFEFLHPGFEVSATTAHGGPAGPLLTNLRSLALKVWSLVSKVRSLVFFVRSPVAEPGLGTARRRL